MRDLMRQCGGKAPVIPEKDELLRYADWNYYERTPQMDALTAFLMNEGHQPCRDAEEIAGEIQYACVIEADMEQVYDILGDYDMELDGSAVEAFVKMMMSVKNNTRLMGQQGLHAQRAGRALLPGARRQRTGRQKENRPERSLSLRQRKEVQKVLRTITEASPFLLTAKDVKALHYTNNGRGRMPSAVVFLIADEMNDWAAVSTSARPVGPGLPHVDMGEALSGVHAHAAPVGHELSCVGRHRCRGLAPHGNVSRRAVAVLAVGRAAHLGVVLGRPVGTVDDHRGGKVAADALQDHHQPGGRSERRRSRPCRQILSR